MDAAAEIGRNPVSMHQIQPEYGDEQADAGRDCRTRLARPNSQARTRTGKYSFSLFSWPRVGLATIPGWSILLLYVMTIHAYIHKYSWVYIISADGTNQCTYNAPPSRQRSQSRWNTHTHTNTSPRSKVKINIIHNSTRYSSDLCISSCCGES